jgi:ADP-ribose pyrophosphatase YjhB (NUDIX family)
MRQAVRAIVVKDNRLLVMRRNKFGHEYYALVGGAIILGENQLQTLERELREEAGITVTNPRLVIVEDAGQVYGIHYIYLCDYASGEPALSPHSEEAKITALGSNLYKPMWLPLNELPEAKLMPAALKEAVIVGLQTGFSEQPVQLTVRD